MEGGRRGTEDSGQRTATQDSAPPLPGAEVSGTPLTNDPTRPADTSLQLGALLDSSVVDCSGVQLGSESFCYVDTTSPCNFYPLSQPLPSTINTEYLHCLIQKITFQILCYKNKTPQIVHLSSSYLTLLLRHMPLSQQLPCLPSESPSHGHNPARCLTTGEHTVAPGFSLFSVSLICKPGHYNQG